MKIFIHPGNFTVSTETGDRIWVGQTYPLEKGYEFVIELGATRHMLIKIMQGNRVVKQGEVPILSSSIGLDWESGTARSEPYEIELDHRSRKPLFPLMDITTQLQQMNIPWYQITPMFNRPELHDGVNHSMGHSHALVTLLSDGMVKRKDFGGFNSEFVVTGASWAVRLVEASITHVYLWNRAADQPQRVLTAIRNIQNGDFTSR